KQAAGINVIGTIFKLIPLAVFIIALLFVFRWTVFADSFSHHAAAGAAKLGSFPEQVKSTMLVTLWAFIGIEGAVVVSNRARSPKDVGKATLLGFLCCLSIYFLISVLPFGRMSQHQLAGLSNPSTAPILQDAVHGNWGGVLMNLGVIIALLTSWLAFTIMIAQIPYAAAKDGSFPAVFAAENAVGSPNVSLWVSSSIMQIGMIVVGLANNAWNTMLSVTGVMILPPYLFCTLYLWKICDTEEYPANLPVKKGMALFCGIAGTVYAVWMIYAAGLTYLLMAFCFLALGIPVYIRARKDDRKLKGDQEVMFTKTEGFAAFLIACVAILAIILFAMHKVKL
ncbi:MAG: amino acid permease, partial [Lentisphaeria bacterium]|nr:amino acid permease [Lentisphaeria bacterium]